MYTFDATGRYVVENLNHLLFTCNFFDIIFYIFFSVVFIEDYRSVVVTSEGVWGLMSHQIKHFWSQDESPS